jgi:hypothetical protein
MQPLQMCCVLTRRLPEAFAAYEEALADLPNLALSSE